MHPCVLARLLARLAVDASACQIPPCWIHGAWPRGYACLPVCMLAFMRVRVLARLRSSCLIVSSLGCLLLVCSTPCLRAQSWLSVLLAWKPRTPTDKHEPAERCFCDPTTLPRHTQGPSTHSDQDRNAGPLALASWRITVSNDADPQPTTISAVIVMVAPLLGWLSACVSACLRACLRDCLLATLLACARACAIA